MEIKIAVKLCLGESEKLHYEIPLEANLGCNLEPLTGRNVLGCFSVFTLKLHHHRNTCFQYSLSELVLSGENVRKCVKKKCTYLTEQDTFDICIKAKTKDNTQ